MYNGYMLKIDGTVFPTDYIQKGTVSVLCQERIVEIWLDAVQHEHKVVAPDGKKTLSLGIIQHDSDQHGEIVAFLQKKDNISIEYFDDGTNEYATGDFRLEEITFPHLSSYGGKIQYDTAEVIFVEN